VGGTNEEWKRLAIEIVSAQQPCKPNALRKALTARGASVRVANETMLTLIRDGLLKRTATGRLVVG
jgi:hypothetical protein